MGRKEIAKENIEMPVTFTFGCVDIKSQKSFRR